MSDKDAQTHAAREDERWFTRSVAAIGGASFFADLGYEIPTSLLPSFLTTTLGAPAAALGLIEGVADGLGGVSRLAGGAIADDPARRRKAAVGGYTVTAFLTAAIGATTAVWQAGALRVAGWIARGLRAPSRSALLAEAVSEGTYGRAFGYERAMDNLGAIGGPLLAIGLVAMVGIRTAILVSVVPGLLAALAIVIGIRAIPKPKRGERKALRLQVRPVLRGRLGRLFLAVSAFELGNAAATLLILRATDVLQPGRSHTTAVDLALGLYAGYNLAAVVASFLGGRLGDRRGMVLVFGLGAAAFAVGYAGLASSGSSIVLIALFFVSVGIGIGFAETAESAAVAGLAPTEVVGSAFGLLAAVQSFGNFAASAVAGGLWTLVSPRAAFTYLAAWMLVSLAALVFVRAGGEN
ncbi:MAG: MFS transporter [Gaiellaceae bacterium]|jgi:MFS family permease